MTSANPSPGDVPEKIVAALDRIARGLRSHRQSVASRVGLTPLQLELLQTIDESPRPVIGLLAKELEVSQPTVSDSLLALERKGHVVRRRSDTDRRRTTMELTDSGRELVGEVRRAGEILRSSVAALAGPDQEAVLDILLSLIGNLLDAGIIQVARTCRTCRFYDHRDGLDARCALLQIPLPPAALRVDCPEHEPLLAS
ncbi:hypothetical protein GCM10022239_12760 [Leifsonia bigeumensis]|uniref:HTH marR-type domain-containing protein n=1 Tax=Leifsonella bigeumensis TaxID=433643 RepID=A0ABP7FIH4_9MICO